MVQFILCFHCDFAENIFSQQTVDRMESHSWMPSLRTRALFAQVAAALSLVDLCHLQLSDWSAFRQSRENARSPRYFEWLGPQLCIKLYYISPTDLGLIGF